jgi:hypothetical protein
MIGAVKISRYERDETEDGNRSRRPSGSFERSLASRDFAQNDMQLLAPARWVCTNVANWQLISEVGGWVVVGPPTKQVQAASASLRHDPNPPTGCQLPAHRVTNPPRCKTTREKRPEIR